MPPAEEGCRWNEAVGRPAPPGEDDGPAGEPAPPPPNPKPNEATPPACWLAAAAVGNEGEAKAGPLRLRGLPKEPPGPLVADVDPGGGVPPGDDGA